MATQAPFTGIDLRELRKAAGVSVSDLALELGLSKRQVERLDSPERRNVKRETWQRHVTACKEIAERRVQDLVEVWYQQRSVIEPTNGRARSRGTHTPRPS